ncbi:MAG: phenylacetate--CoA ligase family protein [Polyangiales bacterium]
MDTYGEIVSRVLHPAWERARGRSTIRLLRHLEETQYRSLDELEALQFGALRRLLQHAYANVPAQRAAMQSVGLHPSDVKSVADLRALPILGRAQVRAQGDARASTAPPFCTIRKTTSGSTGEPLLIAYDRGSEDWRQATKLRGYAWAGATLGARTLHYWGAGRKPASRLQRAKIAVDRGLKRERYVDCGRRSDEDLASVVELLRRDPPEVVIAFSQAIGDLSRYVVSRGVRDWRDIHVICAAERLIPADREAVVQAFGPHVFETYGTREVMLIGAECEAHAGMHTSMENLLVEVIVRDPSGDRPALPGETGEVVVTDLHNYGMPFVRYALGDMATMHEGKPCVCGRALPRIASVDGRVTETLHDANGARVNGLLFSSLVLALGEKLRAFQVVQHRDRAITIRVVPNGMDANDETLLIRDVAKYVGELPIRVERMAELPLDRSGKRRLVVVER